MGDKKIKSEETVENKSMNKELKKNDHIKDDMEKEKVKLTEGKTKKNDLGSNEEVQILERKKCRRRKSREEGELSHMDSEDIDNIVDWASGSDVNKSEKLTKKNICLKKSNDDVMKSNDDVKKLDDAAKKSNDDVGKLPNQNKRKEVPRKIMKMMVSKRARIIILKMIQFMIRNDLRKTIVTKKKKSLI